MARAPKQKKPLPEPTAPAVAQFIVERANGELTMEQSEFLLRFAETPEPAVAAVRAGVHPDDAMEWLDPKTAGRVYQLALYVEQAFLHDVERLLVASATNKEVKATPPLAILNARHDLYGRSKTDVSKGLQRQKGHEG